MLIVLWRSFIDTQRRTELLPSPSFKCKSLTERLKNPIAISYDYGYFRRNHFKTKMICMQLMRLLSHYGNDDRESVLPALQSDLSKYSNN